jgi:hypothetical protein
MARMGGSAAIIHGTVSQAALQPRPGRAGFLDRLLGRQKRVAPVESRAPDGSAFIELPGEDFRPLVAEFGAFLRRSIPAPWEATRMFLDYLAIPALEVHMRGARAAGAATPIWTLEFSFSGCAGMGEISAELGAHWVETWFEKEGARIQAELLNAAGFQAAPPQAPWTPVFVPFEGLGYARRMSEPPDAEWEGSRVFEFDYSLTEMLEQQEKLGSLRALDAKFGSVGADGKCRCQLCSPGFAPLKP